MRSVAPAIVFFAVTLGACEPRPRPTAPASQPASVAPVVVSSAAETATTVEQSAARRPPPAFERQWTGRIQLGRRAPDGPWVAPAPQIIRSASDYEAFVERIPRTRITMRQPAPPSDDPLLRKPAVDFTTHVLVVAYRADTMFAEPAFDKPRWEGDQVVVHVHHPNVAEASHYAALAGIGTYRAGLLRHGGAPILVRDAPAVPMGERLISGITRARGHDVCLQQVGRYDESYVAAHASSRFEFDVECATRGFAIRDPALTRELFDDPDKPGHGAFRRTP